MIPTPLYVTLLLAAGALSVRNYLRQEVEGRGRMLFTRLVAIAMLLGVLLAPAWVRVTVERRPPRIEVLLDASGSMRREAWAGGPTRYDAARDTLTRVRQHYGDGFEYRVRAFDRGLREGAPPAAPEGEGSDLARALHEALREGEARTRATLLFSDGRSTRGASPVLSARGAPAPIHTFGFGRAEDPRPNVQVRDVAVPEEGFSGGEVRVRATVAFDRVPAGTAVPLELRVGGELVQTGSVKATPGETTVELRFRPKQGGLKAVAVTALTPPDLADRAASDDAAESSMFIRDEPIGVLMLGARPGPDLAFARRVLAADPRFAVTARFARDAKRPVSLPGPGEPGGLERVALVVLSGFDPARVPADVQARLAAFVTGQRGALLLISNGVREWSALYDSELKDLLPLKRPEDLRAPEKRFALEPAGIGEHPVTRILDHRQANRQAWQRLPPIAPGVRAVAAGGAQVMLSFPYYPRSIPLLVARRISGGVVMAVNSRETFLWGLLPAAHGDPEAIHEKFVARLAAWAADPTRLGGERIETSKLRFAPGEEVRVDWKGPEGVTPPPAVQLFPLAGGRPTALPLTAAEGGATARAPAPAPGFYELRVPGTEVAPRAVAVHPTREEELAPDPDLAVLRRVADASGGSFLGVDAETTLSTLPRIDATPVVVRDKDSVYWLDVPQIMGVILLLFCLEWGMRRRRNLV